MKKQWEIETNDSGQRLDKFILKTAPKLPKSMVYKLIRKKDIRLNGKRTEPSVILNEGDILTVFIHDDFIGEADLTFADASGEIQVMFEDENILVVNKPKGVIMHKQSGLNDSLTQRMLSYLYKTGVYNPTTEKSFTPAFCNRLDRNTDGLVIAGKNFSSLQIINEKLRNREVSRKYYAVVEGCGTFDGSLIESFHKKDQRKNIAVIRSTIAPDFKPIQTIITTLKTKNDFTLLEVELITGRFHQIRAQLSFLGYPIVGDKKYGSRIKSNFQQLTAYKIKFDFNDTGDALDYLNGKEVSLDIPNDFLGFF